MRDEVITLKKMQDLLTNFGTNDDILVSNTDNQSDKNLIMNYKGFYFGFNGDSNDFFQTLDKFKDNILDAKGLYIQFSVNEEIRMDAIPKIVKEMDYYLNSDIEIVFGTIIDNNISVNSYEYKILLSGLSKIS